VLENKTWERIYFQETYQKPCLFYVLFGTDSMDKLAVSKSRHNIDGMPPELEIVNYSKQEGERQKNYIEGFYQGLPGEFLKAKDSRLYDEVMSCSNIAVVRGEFDDSATFSYLKNTIGIVQAVMETGVKAILDLQIMQWFEPEEWSKKFFEPMSPNVFEHVVILESGENGGTWLHTRGMRKFGRPDLSIRKVTPDKMELGVEIINRFIQAFAHGVIPDEKREIKIRNSVGGIFGRLLGDYENMDFNNYYFEIDGI